ncbi:MAG: tetratricopeptide repeat protein [Pirellulales bacterium]
MHFTFPRAAIVLFSAAMVLTLAMAPRASALQQVVEESKNSALADPTTPAETPPATAKEEPTPAESNGPPAVAKDAKQPTPAEPAKSSGKSPEGESPALAPVESEQPGAEPARQDTEVILKPVPVESESDKTPEDTITDESGEKQPTNKQPGEPTPADAQPKPITDVQPATFNNVRPGISTTAEVEKAWGPPTEITKVKGATKHVYAIEPFQRVEATFINDKVAMIVVHLQKAFPSEVVAKQLELEKIRPVAVTNDAGQTMGAAYPERGVVFSFAPGEAQGQVAKIFLEPIDAQPFVLRAETNRQTQYASSLADLDYALKVDPKCAAAHWLAGEILAAIGRHAEALKEAEEAVRLEPKNPEYRLSHARILEQSGQYADAVAQTKEAVAQSGERPEIKARGLCQWGDQLAAGPERNYKQAMSYHLESIKLAQSLSADRRVAVRRAAKDTLLNAHLAVAGDIAWGYWKNKDTVVPKWLARASSLADDMAASEDGKADYQFRVSQQALAALVGLQGKLDPAQWADEALRLGRKELAKTDDLLRKRRVEWELGLALYDALQVHHMRKEFVPALKYGDLAVSYLEQGGSQRQETPGFAYLLGRLYFRMGSIHALEKNDHPRAVEWFAKAIPLLEKPIPASAAGDVARQGETFVSMGISYWESGKADEAVQLTQHGLRLMDQAVKDGLLEEPALAVPYANLSSMHRQLGEDAEAQRFAELAAKSQGSKKR